MALHKPSKKKVPFKIHSHLREYLQEYEVETTLPIQYEDMLRYTAAIPLLNKENEDMYWKTVIYPQHEMKEINDACCKIYALLKTGLGTDAMEHLKVARIDFCLFGNTNPFRVRISNELNDNYDHFYIKKVDASRVYGLELEPLLSPNTIDYLVDKNTIIEEHIAGIPGDDFIEKHLNVDEFEQTRIAKEFVKFNERCFARLLGDMRSYNYVIDITPDIEGNQYRLRAIDFDQQSYEGKKTFYLPQFFKENNPILELGFKLLTYDSVKQYQLEEEALIARRAKGNKSRLENLLKVMTKDQISTFSKVKQLKDSLTIHHQSELFKSCQSMGDIVYTNIHLLTQKEFRQGILDVK